MNTLVRSRPTHDAASRGSPEHPVGRPFPTLRPFPALGGDPIIPPPPAVDGTARTVTPLCRLRTNIVP
jgi:hypothetical protein